MPTYFIADLHLSETRPELTELFLRFMREKSTVCEGGLYFGRPICFWIGDDEHSELTDTVSRAVRNVAEGGWNVFLFTETVIS